MIPRQSRPSARRLTGAARRLRLESLESRLLLAGDTYEVLNTQDSGEGSLRNAIEQANSNEGTDTIVFRQEAGGEIQLTHELTISDDLIIRGPGAEQVTVSGQHKSRVFRIDANPSQQFGASVDALGAPLTIDVSISDVTIADGLATDAPGFPRFDPAGQPLFPNFGFGGGLFNRGNDVTLAGVHFADNQAGSTVLPVEGFGAGAAYEQATGDYTGPAGTSNLGPIVVDGSVDLASIVPTVFEPNPTLPGEVFFRAPFAGTQTVTDANGDALAGSFSGEVVFQLGDLGTPDVGLPVGEWTADFQVDPISSTGRYSGATGVLEIVAFNPPGFNPFADTLPFDWTIDGDLTLPNAAAAGGGIANEFGGSLTVVSSQFENNSTEAVLFSGGGAITSDLGPTVDGSTTAPPDVAVTRSRFFGNTSAALTGQIDAVDGNGIPLFAFSGLAGGGALLNVTGQMTVHDSRFVANGVNGGPAAGGLPDLPDSSRGGAGLGGAIFSSDISPFGAAESTLTVIRSSFTENAANGGSSLTPNAPGGEGAGGAVYVGNGGEADIARNHFRANAAHGGAGGADSIGGPATGGAVAGTGGAMLELGRNRFVENVAAGGQIGGVARGGAFALSVSNVPGGFPGTATASLSRDSFVGNHAGGTGLGGGLGGAIYNDGDLQLERVQLTRNRAVGDAEAIIALSPVVRLVGGASGGGIANFGILDVYASRFKHNAALGADDADSSSSVFPEPSFPGNSFGGAIANYRDAEVNRSSFVRNVAEAGDGGHGDFATIGSGGGIYNDAVLGVSGSQFAYNRAVGGDSGISALHNGHALGGALSSGSLAGGAVLSVESSRFVGNAAEGGNDNVVLLPAAEVPPADAPNNAYGGAILVYEGAANISRTVLRNNRAQGGNGETDNGNLGVGGGMFLFNFVGTGVNAEISRLLAIGNEAIGGVGGDGIGGGVAVGTLGSLFISEVGTTTITRSTIHDNRAIGGRDGGDGLGGGVANVAGGETLIAASFIKRNQALGTGGGDGLGGGIFNAEAGHLELARDFIFRNLATGQDEGGTGLGGGVYNEGELQLDRFTRLLTRFNQADEDPFDNWFGV